MIKISTDKAPAAIGPYSQAVKKGNMLFLSGQLGIDPETGSMQDGIKSQTEQVFKNMGEVLKAADADFSNIVKATVFLSDMSYFGDVNEVYKTVFSEPYPARSAFAVKELPLKALVEIEVIAII